MPFYDYYGDRSATMAGMAFVRAQMRRVLERLLQAHPKARSLLEIGPGRGVFADMCTTAGIRYVALDINYRLVHHLATRGHHGAQAHAVHLPVTTGTFDIAFASHVIEHSPSYPDALAFLNEMCRIVAPGGVVALVTPDYLALREDFWNCDYSHSFVTTRRRLHQMMHDAGCVVVDDHSLYGPFDGAFGYVSGQLLGGRIAGAVARAVPGVIGEKLYKLRLTFAHAILIIGRTPS